MEREKTVANDVTDRGDSAKYTNKSYNPKTKKTTNPIKKRADLNRHLPNDDTQRPTGPGTRSTCLVTRETPNSHEGPPHSGQNGHH